MSHTGFSVVDYFISQTCYYSKIININMNDLTEFSDQCVIEMTFACKFQTKGENPKTFDKFSWAPPDVMNFCIHWKKKEFYRYLR